MRAATRCSFPALLTAGGNPPKAIKTTAAVTIEAGVGITGIVLETEAEVPGITDAAFAEAANKAKEICPVSKALAVGAEHHAQGDASKKVGRAAARGRHDSVDSEARVLTPKRIPTERFRDAEAALARLELIYDTHTAFLRDQFARAPQERARCRRGSGRPIPRS